MLPRCSRQLDPITAYSINSPSDPQWPRWDRVHLKLSKRERDRQGCRLCLGRTHRLQIQMPGFGHLLQHLYGDLHSCPMGQAKCLVWETGSATRVLVTQSLCWRSPPPVRWHWKEGEDQSCWTRHAPQPPALPVWHSPLPRHADGSHGAQHQPDHSHPLRLPVFLQPALSRAKVENSVLHKSPGRWMGLAPQETSPGPAHSCRPLLMLWGSETGRHAPFCACQGVERRWGRACPGREGGMFLPLHFSR